jgi:hypothetical protein
MKLKRKHILFGSFKGSQTKIVPKSNHFFVVDPKKHVFRKNLNVFFSRFLNTRDRNTLLVDDTLNMNLYLMICIVLYFWNRLRVHITIEIICFLLSFLTWSPFIRLVTFRLTLGIIHLGLLEA